MVDKILYEEKVKLTPLAFDKFTIERCKKEYVELYENLLKVE